MGKIKTMLASILIASIASIALAFNAKKYGVSVICATTITNAEFGDIFVDKSCVADPLGIYYCTTIEGSMCNVQCSLVDLK